MIGIAESAAEETLLDWFRSLGYTSATGPDILPERARPEREQWEDVLNV